MPLVSVITPSHDGSYLTQVWKSLKAQTYKNFEWVLVPNGPLTSLPREIVEDRRVKIFPAVDIFDNVGALKRFACQHARGDLLVELDHDDLLTPNCLAELVKRCDVTKAQFLFSDFATVNAKLEPLVYNGCGWETYNVTFQGHLVVASRAFAMNPSSLSCIQFSPNHVRAWTRLGYEQAGGHSADYQVADDYDLLLRTYLTGVEVIQIPECLYIYRTHEEAVSVKRNEKIQEIQVGLFNTSVNGIVTEWCRREKLASFELAISTGQQSNFELLFPLNGVLPPSADKLSTYRFPGLAELKDNSVGQLRCNYLLPFLPRELIMPFFEECYRVLAPGGWLRCVVPSTDGAAAFSNPIYRSYWNLITFKTFTNQQCAELAGGHRCRFQYLRAWETWDTLEDRDSRLIKACVDLVALKDQKQPGIVDI